MHQLLYSYGQLVLDLDINSSSSLLTTFWILFCIFRSTAVFQAQFIAPRTILFINVIICIGSSAVMYSFDQVSIIWAAIGMSKRLVTSG